MESRVWACRQSCLSVKGPRCADLPGVRRSRQWAVFDWLRGLTRDVTFDLGRIVMGSVSILHLHPSAQ